MSAEWDAEAAGISEPRPDLSESAPEVVRYIEALEAALGAAQQQARSEGRSRGDSRGESAGTDGPGIMEDPTTVNVITISRQGRAKRTPRHLYGRQRRGGMGVFDLETGEQDQPDFLLLGDVQGALTFITNQGRAFRMNIADLPETAVHARGENILGRFPLREGEHPAVVFTDPLPGEPGAYLSLISARGQVRRIGSQYLGKSLQPGTVLHNAAEGGEPAACCWSTGGDDLVLITRQGLGIRFAERHVPVRGCLGMRVEPGDGIVAAVACGEADGVFLLGEDGKGTIRLMSGFSANKSPGAGGKIAMKADRIVGAVPVKGSQMEENTDIFALSRLGKMIRFGAGEVPPKEGVVQGVNCMNLRADQCVAVAAAVVGA